jgi:Protein of unknown function (DUF1488)
MGLELMPFTESYDDILDIVRFMGWSGDRWVRCGIRREALLNVARVRKASDIDPVNLYRSHKAPIHALASAKFQAGRFEDDGLVLVSSVDLNS